MRKYSTHPARTFSRPSTTLPSESINRCSSGIKVARVSRSCRLIAFTNSRATDSNEFSILPLYPRRATPRKAKSQALSQPLLTRAPDGRVSDPGWACICWVLLGAPGPEFETLDSKNLILGRFERARLSGWDLPLESRHLLSILAARCPGESPSNRP